MNTAHKTDEEKLEYFDPPEVLEEKVNKLVEMIKKAEHFVAFTGAGISTSTGIPDFRSGVNTQLKTGPGAWEKLAQNVKNDKKYQRVSMLRAIPSLTHMALNHLNTKGYLKFLISQNVDGLHRRSGFPPDFLAELHGNTNLERCTKCKKDYMRDYSVRNAQEVHDHLTGRYCDNPKCKGELYDTIINFGENLPIRELDDGFVHSQLADLHLVLGSSLRVTPAAQMPATTAKLGRNLVIVNLQKTPLDDKAALRINAMCDDVMKMVMKKLNLDIPDFILERRVLIERTSENTLLVSGEDSDESPYDFFKFIMFGEGKDIITKSKAPYEFKVNSKEFSFEFGFFDHYDEGNFKLNFKIEDFPLKEKQKFLALYSPKEEKWIKCKKYN